MLSSGEAPILGRLVAWGDSARCCNGGSEDDCVDDVSAATAMTDADEVKEMWFDGFRFWLPVATVVVGGADQST